VPRSSLTVADEGLDAAPPPTAAPPACALCSTTSTPTARTVRTFAVRSATLDDVFLALTGHTATTPKTDDKVTAGA